MQPWCFILNEGSQAKRYKSIYSSEKGFRLWAGAKKFTLREREIIEIKGQNTLLRFFGESGVANGTRTRNIKLHKLALYH